MKDCSLIADIELERSELSEIRKHKGEELVRDPQMVWIGSFRNWQSEDEKNIIKSLYMIPWYHD